jgi:diguanylate cyclase (GGDEF)-like protein
LTVDVVADNRLDDRIAAVLLHLADPQDRRRSAQLLDRQAEIIRQIALGDSLELAIHEVLGFTEHALPGFRSAAFVVEDGALVAATSTSVDRGTVDRIAAALVADEPPWPSALSEEEIIVAVDLDEPQWSELEVVAPAGAGCAWSVPIRSDRGARMLGTIELYGPAALHPRDEDWTVLRLAGRLITIAVDHARAQQQLIHDAEIDPLTGTPNRRVVSVALAQLFEHGDYGRAVCFIDLDRLKVVNDALGHDAGDLLIREAADRLTRAVGDDGLVGRFGGDEFVAIAHSADIECDVFAQRCLDAFSRPIMIGGRNWHLSASIGAVVVDDQRTPTEVLRDADTAMYEAKRAGRGRWRRFQTSDRELVRRRMQLEQRLGDGIRYGNMWAWFQPVVRASDWGLVGVEALARWEIDPGSWVAPTEFVPLAEELGLIDELGSLMLRQAIDGREAIVAARGEPCAVSINVSPVQVRSDHLFAELDELRAERGAVPSVCLEMTEEHMIDDTESTLERLHRMRSFGVQLAVDDFGTGYSSLAMLHQVPADVLKIDRELVSQVGTPSGQAVLAAVIGVAQAYDLRTVAEGVETVDEALALRDMGVDHLQGFLFAPAEPIDQLITRVTKRAWAWDVDPADVGVGAAGSD